MAYFGAFMMLVQAVQQSQQAKTEGELYAANAQLQKEEDQEATRRAKKQMAKKEATARSRIAASGIVGGQGSAEVYMQELREANRTEVAWMNKATESRYSLGLRGASNTRQAGQNAAIGTAASAAGSVWGTYQSGSKSSWGVID